MCQIHMSGEEETVNALALFSELSFTGTNDLKMVRFRTAGHRCTTQEECSRPYAWPID